MNEEDFKTLERLRESVTKACEIMRLIKKEELADERALGTGFLMGRCVAMNKELDAIKQPKGEGE